MIEYEIYVESQRTRDFLIDRMIDNEYTKEEIEAVCKKLDDIEGEHMLSTLQQFFELIDEISDITHENYSIDKDGDYILMFVD